jgi:predicted metalloprotease
VKWQGLRKSENVEDRRRMSGPVMVGGGGIGVLILALIVMFLGGDPRALLENAGPQPGNVANQGAEPTAEEEAYAEFVSRILGDTEDVWSEIFRTKFRKEYRPPTLVLFKNAVDTGCGSASSATGPFYCPGDQKIYIDTSFFEVMNKKLGAGGDFAYAYVIAHEVAHHVQRELGITQAVDAKRGRVSEVEYNDLSVRLELQADFLAGVWAHHGQKQRRFLEEGDLDEALKAAAAIGDDKLQREGQGFVRPETFTHGTSEQRYTWLLKGLKTGDVDQMDTFQARSL